MALSVAFGALTSKLGSKLNVPKVANVTRSDEDPLKTKSVLSNSGKRSVQRLQLPLRAPSS